MSALLPLTALAIMIVFGRAWALDPHRALTQAFLRKWQLQQGLPQPTIFKILQTADGYLWLGTRSGLFRFDGMRFVAARVSSGPALDNLWIQDLCEDREHNLWIATNDAGLIRLKEGVAVQFGRDAGLPSENVTCFLVDREGELWAGTEQGLARWADGRFSVLHSEAPGGHIQALCEAKDGTIWIGGEGSPLTFWNGTTLSPRALASVPAGSSIRALLSTGDGSVWVGTTAGLVHVVGEKEKLITQADGLVDDSIECLAESRDGTLWVGTRDGLSRLPGEEIESFGTRDGLSQSTVFTLCEDHEGGIWAGTKHGLNQFTDRRTIPLTESEGLPSNETGPLLQDQAGTVWVGTLDKGLAQYDGRHFSAGLSAANGLPSDTVRALADGGEGHLWVGTERGLCRMRAGRIEQCFTADDGLPANTISCLCRDQRGVLWAGTTAGLTRYEAGRFVRPRGDEESLKLPILALVDRGAVGLVASTSRGLFRCADDDFQSLPTRQNLPPEIDAFYADAEGLLWMGTRGSGLALIDGDKTFRFTIRDGLYDDDIFGIVGDAENRLWMACSRGIFFVSRAELRKFAAGEIAHLTSTPFSPTDAQRTIECQDGVQPVVWKMQDGRIWFSTIHGVIIIDPERMVRVLPLPPVYVEEAQVNGQDVSPGNISRLPPGRTNLYFRYTALSFASSTRISFRYKLENFDKDWVEAGPRREAFYTNVPPGSYQFRVSAANRDGPWSEAAKPIDLAIEPHFYQTRWFIPFIVGLVAAGAWIVLRLRVLQVRAKLNAVVAERSRIARELHDTLIQGFSGITMQMQALAARLRASNERETLEEIIQDAGVCLRDARRSVGGLRNPPGTADRNGTGLAAALAQAARQLTETRDVRLVLQLAQEPLNIPVDAEYHLLRIAQEAISNAIKHSSAGTIEVSLERTAQQVRLTVRDDGSGFAANGNHHPQPGHYGLIGMRERASQIHAALHVDSTPGSGTTIRLELPLDAPVKAVM